MLKTIEILKKLCQESRLDGPHFEKQKIRIGNIIYEFKDGFGYGRTRMENMALNLLHRWKEISPGKYSLVPEHLETRTLYHPRKPAEPQGQLMMWLDMFEEDTVPPSKPREISMRKPESWLTKKEDAQTTDIHYRSLTGEGNFNWRFVFPFDYLAIERKLVVMKKVSIFSWDETEFKVQPVLELQVWDADHLSSDDYLGKNSKNLFFFNE
ncbi:otoferlin [Trichonephila clavata]|uniref:Otoferlin n=1 Tax=Trichonephila clavata TaxID=2740835 RepID=A0A8X6LR03_TRICU|nr:otoferlin [Trichonephila clavata]